MNLGLGDVSVDHLVVSVWSVRLIPRSGLCGMIDVRQVGVVLIEALV
jgi:hypothetical protein